jgi:hypothetical protein
MRSVLALAVMCMVAISGCGIVGECGPLADECLRAVTEMENAGADVVSVRDIACPRPDAVRCFVLTLADGEQMSAEAYPDHVDIGRFEATE